MFIPTTAEANGSPFPINTDSPFPFRARGRIAENEPDMTLALPRGVFHPILVFDGFGHLPTREEWREIHRRVRLMCSVWLMFDFERLVVWKLINDVEIDE